MGLERDIKTLLDRAFGKGLLSRDGINYAIKCPSCTANNSGKKKLIVRLDDGRYQCWICGMKGSNVAALVGSFRPDLVDYAQRFRLKKIDKEPEQKPEVVLPKGAVLLGVNRKRLDPDVKAAINYLTKRGINRKDMLRWRMLSCTSGKFRRRIIVPSFDCDGNPNYFIARSIDETAKIKYLNAHTPKVGVIFNEIDIDWENEVTLVEGVFDAIKCSENTIPILGSSLSTRSELLKKLMRHQTPCVVSLDPDMKQKAHKLADLLVSSGCSVRIAFAPTNKDLGDLTKEEASRVLSSAVPYTDIMRITHKINEIKSGSLL